MYNFTTITQTQKDVVADVVAKFASTQGKYTSTMLKGIAHGYCTSGILTDALSVNDAERLTKYFTNDGIHLASLEMLNDFVLEVDNAELECMQVINLLVNAQTDSVDFETLCAYMQAQL